MTYLAGKRSITPEVSGGDHEKNGHGLHLRALRPRLAAQGIQDAGDLPALQESVLEPEEGSPEVGKEFAILEQTCACGKAMTDDVCSDANCRYNVAVISAHEAAALDAITGGKTMGQMLRSLPANTPKDELQKYGEAYDRLRRGKRT